MAQVRRDVGLNMAGISENGEVTSDSRKHVPEHYTLSCLWESIKIMSLDD